MKVKDLRQQSKMELLKRLSEKKIELNQLDFDIKVGQEQNYKSRGKLRKEIARILTVIESGEFAPEKTETEAKPVVKKSPKTLKAKPNNSKKAVKSVKITKSKTHKSKVASNK